MKQYNSMESNKLGDPSGIHYIPIKKKHANRNGKKKILSLETPCVIVINAVITIVHVSNSIH